MSTLTLAPSGNSIPITATCATKSASNSKSSGTWDWWNFWEAARTVSDSHMRKTAQARMPVPLVSAVAGFARFGAAGIPRRGRVSAGVNWKIEIRNSKLEDVHRQECLCYHRLLPPYLIDLPGAGVFDLARHPRTRAGLSPRRTRRVATNRGKARRYIRFFATSATK
jgi:hypothetical protein